MHIYHSLDELPEFHQLVLTQGTFDGVHMGHRKVLSDVVKTARNLGGESMLLTFYPHPRLVLYPDDNSLRMLNTVAEKAKLVEECGINHMLVLPFTSHTAKLSPLEFVRDVLVAKLGVKVMVIGYDHRFGRNREGSFHDLVQYGEMLNFKVKEIPAGEIDHIAVSSTRIRKALLAGDVKLTTELLGRRYTIQGTVVHGQKLGRELGFPTANIQVDDPYKLIPANGVYTIRLNANGQWHAGVMNIGQNPTIQGKGYSIEAHLLDFTDNIYDIATEIEFCDYLRPEFKFNNLEELKTQIAEDCKQARFSFGLV
jgi:riboflavin kinase/FMN adenylyltransferase